MKKSYTYRVPHNALNGKANYKKPFQAKRKLLSGILNWVDAAIEKTERLAADVKQYQTNKAERETAGIGNAEAVNLVELAVVAEPEFQYGGRGF